MTMTSVYHMNSRVSSFPNKSPTHTRQNLMQTSFTLQLVCIFSVFLNSTSGLIKT